ncbi:MAG TPA: thioredoxin-like domain-containing protein [Vicinamibacterales bacterium]|nr:thioredoxin-like domain-containing protein [Vicinamibacterales bacterium]
MSDAGTGPQGPLRAPDLDGAVEWLNAASPVSLADLRGKVVLIDFWTYGCVNCMHVLRDLKMLEQRFPDELVVIGVHSPKFTHERSTDSLRRILVRYEIEHPVANDANHVIWRRYGVQAWPTRVIVDPVGNLVGTAMGEGNLDGFINAIAGVIRVFDEQGAINRAPLPRDLERTRHADCPLLYPGKVLADQASERLFIADSNHNRIVVSTLAGDRIETIGSGIRGDSDGIFAQARFNRPQGLALDGDCLYVADTGNDQVRVVDFGTRAVHTVDVTNLKSPWDLALRTGILIVAMAGPHQIWVIDLLHDRAYPYAGTGEEGRRDGAVNEAAFAQPSGLAIAGDTLYVSDAESNTIREVTLPPKNGVRTIAGGDLFNFGDRDGEGNAVRLQHPLGVAMHKGCVLIADTYNHKIKMLDPSSGRVHTVAGSGTPGRVDGRASTARFYEPGGLSVAGDTLFVADTNNHAVRTVDLHSFMVSTLTFEGLAPPAAWSYLRKQ